MKFHNLHGIIAVINMHSTFSVLNNTYSVDEMQQLEYLPAQFDFKVFLEPFSIFLDEMLCMACM